MIDRRRFLWAVGASGVAPALLGAGEETEEQVKPLRRALVLSGGGAKGAYEAGVIGAMVATDGVSDGSQLREYDAVCGTSIGALNAWFVATAQYSKARQLWYGIASENVIRLKPEYAALENEQSGVLNRLASVFRLVGLVHNQQAVLQSEPAFEWMKRYIDPATPLVIPMVFAVTNLTRQRPEYFYVREQGVSQQFPQRVTHALRALLGPHTIVREATPDILHKAIFASIAIPVAFDPVIMPGPNGRDNAYCDGGVASNSPVGIAHALASAADVVLLEPPLEPDENIDDAVEIGFAAYSTMQRKILETEMRTSYFQSLGKRALSRLSTAERLKATEGDETLETFVATVPAIELRYIRPQKPLPVDTLGFNDQPNLIKTYDQGWMDVGRGFAPYDWETFQI